MFSRWIAAVRRLARHDHERAPLLQRDVGRALDERARRALADRADRAHRARADAPSRGCAPNRRPAPRRDPGRRTRVTCASHAVGAHARPQRARPIAMSDLRVAAAASRDRTRSAARAARADAAPRSSRTAYGAPDAPVIATTSGSVARRSSRRRAMPTPSTRRISRPASTNPKNSDADDAVHREERGVEPRRSPGFTSECSYSSSAATTSTPAQYSSRRSRRPDTRPARPARARRTVTACSPRDTAIAPRSPSAAGMECRPVRAVEARVLQRVQHVEARAPTSPPPAPARSSSHHGSLHAPVTAR